MVDITKIPQTNYSWGLSRIATQIKVGDGVWQDLELPNNLVISARNEQEIIDGLDQDNAGYAYKPQRFTFSLDIPANTPTYEFLRELLLRRFQFSLLVSEDSSDNPNVANGIQEAEYQGLVELLSNCVFDSMSEPFRVGQLTVVSFEGKALRFKTGTDPNNKTAAGATNVYGEGRYSSITPLYR